MTVLMMMMMMIVTMMMMMIMMIMIALLSLCLVSPSKRGKNYIFSKTKRDVLTTLVNVFPTGILAELIALT